MEYEILWDVSRDMPTDSDVIYSAMAHEQHSVYYTFFEPMPNRFHPLDWANALYDKAMVTEVAWHTMLHDHYNTLTHISF